MGSVSSVISSKKKGSSVFSPKSKFSLDAVMKSLFSKSCIVSFKLWAET